MARNPLYSTRSPGGIQVFADMTASTGNKWYVDSGASSSGNGKSPDTPFTTIAAANTAASADNDDWVIVMPGHAETISAAADIALTKAGLTLLGIGNGSNRPTITFDTADTADLDIDAANITIENFIFSANFADIAAAIDVNADDFTLRKCHFQATATDMNFLICVQDAAAAASDRITIDSCTSSMLDASDTHFVNLAGTGDGHIIKDNILHGNWGTMCIGGAGVVTNCSVLHNYIFNIAVDADTCISMAATATGICADNRCTGGHASQGIVPGDLGALENYYEQSTSDLSGVIEPAIA